MGCWEDHSKDKPYTPAFTIHKHPAAQLILKGVLLHSEGALRFAREELADEGIFGVEQLCRGARLDDLSVPQHGYVLGHSTRTFAIPANAKGFGAGGVASISAQSDVGPVEGKH